MTSQNDLLLPRENVEKQLRSCEGYRRNNPWWAGRSYRIALTCLSAMDERDAAKARIREFEAKCAAMREALVQISEKRCRCECPCGEADSAAEIAAGALSGDAGRALLELVEALELVADIARNRGNPDDELGCAVAALDALEQKR